MKSGPIEAGEESRVGQRMEGMSRGISIADLVLRIIAFFGTAGSAVAMGTTDQTLPFSTSNFQFRAKFDDLPMFTFFVIANAVECGYLLVISLPLSIFHIIRSKARTSRLILIFLDAVMLALLTSGASAATAIVYLAHKGNANANWSAVCQQFDLFCERISGSLVGSFGVIIIMILLIILSAIAVSRPLLT